MKTSAATGPGIEPLESRIAPATHIWKGPATGGLWNTVANWIGGVPTTGEGGGTILEFDSGIGSIDNIGGLVVDEIHFTTGGSIITGSAGVTLTMSGNAVTNNILNDTGDNNLGLPLALTDKTIYAEVPTGHLTLSGNISGSVGLLLTDDSTFGVLTLTGTNTYNGDTTVRAGTLELNSTAVGNVVPQNLVIGDASGAADSAIVSILQPNQVPDTANVHIFDDGKLTLFQPETVGSVTLDHGSETGGLIDAVNGALMVNGDITVQVTATTTGHTPAQIQGTIHLNSGTHSLIVAAGNGPVDVTVNANLSDYTKTGPGVMKIIGPGAANNLTIKQGTVLLDSPGTNDAVQGTVQVGTNTNTSATLRLLHSDQIDDASNLHLVVASDGLFDLNGFSETLRFLDVTSGTTQGGSVTTGGGLLTVTDGLLQRMSGTDKTPATISGQLDLHGGTITLAGGGGFGQTNLIISANVVGSTGYQLAGGTGILEVRGSGPTGPVKVISGTLVLNSSGTNDAIQGDLTIGAAGGLDTPTVKLGHDFEISNSANVTLLGDGTLDLVDFSEDLGHLVMTTEAQSGAQIFGGDGSLTLLGNVDVPTIGTVGENFSQIDAKLALASGNHVFTVADQGVNDEGANAFFLRNTISGAGSLIKAGPGLMVIDAALASSGEASTFTGATIVREGGLYLSSINEVSVTSNQITVGQGLGAPGSAVLRLVFDSSLPAAAAITVGSDGVFELGDVSDSTISSIATQSGGVVQLGTGQITSHAFNLVAGSTLSTDTTGQLAVVGTVTLGGHLALPFSSQVSVGATIKVIDNDGADAVSGTFAGLPEGSIFGTPQGLFKVSYVGGDGNDVTVTAVDAAGFLTIGPKGQSATYTDVDGDLVTVKITKGVLTKDNFQFGAYGSGLATGYQLQELDLSAAQYTGTAITITAKPTALGGDGHTNVGVINATGRDVTTVTVPGDLGLFEAGDNDAKKPGVAKLTVNSIGALGSITQRETAGATTFDAGSETLGILATSASSIVVKGSVEGASLTLGAVGTIAIGGSLTGVGSSNAVITVDSAKKISVGGSIIAEDGLNLAQISSTHDLGGLLVGHDLAGPVRILAGGKLGSVSVKGSVAGVADNPTLITAAGSAIAPKAGLDTAIVGLTIGGSLENTLIRAGYTPSGTAFSADASIGKISIGGDFRASEILAGADPGPDQAFGTADDVKLSGGARDLSKSFSTIASLIIKGQALGTTSAISTADQFAIVAEQIKSAKIGGIALKLKAGARSTTDTFALGFASSAPGDLPSDLYLHEIADIP